MSAQASYPSSAADDFDLPPPKRTKLECSNNDDADLSAVSGAAQRPDELNAHAVQPRASLEARRKGEACIKQEYLVRNTEAKDTQPVDEPDGSPVRDADHKPSTSEPKGPSQQNRTKARGQNKSRNFGSSRDEIGLCASVALSDEFSPQICPFGGKCKFEHDIRKYLKEGKREDLDTFDGQCPVLQNVGVCSAGWRCRFASLHSTERATADGRKELVLLKDPKFHDAAGKAVFDVQSTIFNVVDAGVKIDLRKKKVTTDKSDKYSKWLDQYSRVANVRHQVTKVSANQDTENASRPEPANDDDITSQEKLDNRAKYVEPPFLPSEKRRLYYGPETPVLAPLTTQGNLPFRRLCVQLGAQVTWSEMAMSMPLINGEKGEWALLKAHETELQPPAFRSDKSGSQDYNNSKDLKFGAQIAAPKPWSALKATEIITSLCPSLRAVDLNCGCPIDLVFRQGAGSGLLDSHAKLEKILRGMNAVSGDVPVTAKIRMGTKDAKPTADRLIERLALGGADSIDAGLGPCGVAAITLHGRSRQQRYTRSADWTYISECAALIKHYNEERRERADTTREGDSRFLNGQGDGKMFFLGNGDCYSHVDYYNHIERCGVDSVMVARGALIKPWIFEEIEKGQYLDKSATERLQYIEKFVRFGLQYWGSDEVGVGTTRRFLLEWLSFACRYVPLGLLEHLPPNIQDRPPAYRGRDELETLLSSENYRDWIKISDMFLGPAHKDFRFEPKHKSNAYAQDGDYEAEG